MKVHDIAKNKKGSGLSWKYEEIEYALNVRFVAISSKTINRLTNNDITVKYHYLRRRTSAGWKISVGLTTFVGWTKIHMLGY